MKVRFKGPAFDVECEGKDSKDCFGQIAQAVEVFGHTACGACGAQGAIPVVRERDGHHFYEMRCRSCGACLAFGQKKDGGALFPKRKDKDGNWLDGAGWVKFRRAEAQEDFI